ncbi:Pentatricopeptide repeat-containing protein [Wickerhamomyces ciferrii]|uniref:Mitochondrial 15S rRNA processing factor CCM1 n=1 Tax=Wickerhamomyces ciferrii (strain ATCC 14091 / BCRC 22168 / CBS 111 / JCM 3599 / NBRC 0793 / NRRL Y-1031 F-60-10) TaxID=1206466 RepID=K0KH42_WICCF|nr:Pentatricopeptide repeat-containing protein [Wickerhamomyces ciferrii]CCH41502.1 Pentatricopeptide repeat-containing protein [Wickerhamomyces ciferrii]
MTSLGLRVIDLLQKPATYESFQHLCQRFKTRIYLPKFNKAQEVGENQTNIRNQRLSVPRKSCLKTTYVNLLRNLYPLEHVNHEKLYNAYSSLPSPQPLHVQPQHLEQLMDQFVNSGGNFRGRNARFLTDIISDLANCGMKLSIREINNYLYLMNYNQDTDLTIVKGSYHSILDMGEFNMSTFNTFLKIGIDKQDEGFMSQILDDIVSNNFKFDRFTYDMLMRYAGSCGDYERCLVFFEMFLDEGHILDISMINTVITVLLENNQIQEATEIVDLIFKKPEINNTFNILESNFSNSTHERRINAQELTFLDFHKIQTPNELLFKPVPTLSTFQPLIKYFTTAEHFNLSKIFKCLEEMNDLKIAIPQSIYINIFNSLKEQDIKDLQYLKFILNFMMNETNLKFNSPLFDSIIDTFLKHSGYQNKLINGIENQWLTLKQNMRGTPYSRRSEEIEEFSTESINKLLMFYEPRDQQILS